MSIPYPNKPWNDGQSFQYTASDGSKVIASYNASRNAWTFARVESGSSSGGGGVAGVSSIIAGNGISVDQATGDVTVTATGSGGTGAVSSVNNKTGDVVLTTNDLTNNSGFITDAGVTKIVAGTNVTISGDGTGEVTINSTGSTGGGDVTSVNGQNGVVVLDINDLTDVQVDDTPGTAHYPDDDDGLVWDKGMSHWMPKPLAYNIVDQRDFAYTPSSNTAELLGPTSNSPAVGVGKYVPIPNSQEGGAGFNTTTIYYDIGANPGFHAALLDLTSGDEVTIHWYNIDTLKTTVTTFSRLDIINDYLGSDPAQGKLVVNSTMGTFGQGDYPFKIESPHIINGTEPLRTGDILVYNEVTEKWTASAQPSVSIGSYPTLP